MNDLILVRYGELALKGKNRSDFENRLLQNIREKLKPFSGAKVKKTFGRMFVELNGQPMEPVVQALSEVFGVVGISPAKQVDSDLDRIQEAALDLAKEAVPRAKTFKVIAKRTRKDFPHRSQELNHLVGSYILKRIPELRVDVHNPEFALRVEVRKEATYLYGSDIPGPGGLPVGSSGRVMLMLSGGIDSPVAGYLSMKRGAALHAVYFHSYPFTSERAQQKVEDLGRILARYGGKIRLYVVPFTDIQTEIKEKCPSSYMITIMRRFMVRISEELARKNKALALVTGESLGQVASQTLESMNAINDVTRMPILRPLVGMDKQEIMQISRTIGTYETSILPYEDCCTVFQPKSPVTRPTVKRSRELESPLNVEQLVSDAVEGTKCMVLKSDREEDEFSLF
ncbi:tRNA uracil 4-sulfurtransferase ThiI [Melghirimyces algeriensis]|uniref:Probable tRNA sulfurtransferase n=1 Tax=Melghirimyces algeriensis TaxID=910412 RepID=A0A521BQT7_9BACL|nr:tRNA uracil 4-sulfurtransferase ThiI [Melghirimyces algeriensis]SMO49534.1 thiamine biosynthesis protein ThiI [Melghirimyces algeriensis]